MKFAHLKNETFHSKLANQNCFKKQFFSDFTTRRVLFFTLETFDQIKCCLFFATI